MIKETLTKSDIKAQAKIMKEFFKNVDIDIKLSNCYQLLALINKYESWNHMSHNLNDDNS